MNQSRRSHCPSARGFAALFLWSLTTSLPAATGTIADVQHVVILVQENRSFDHYFGSLKGVRGFNDPNALMLLNGNSDFYQPYNGYVLPYPLTNQCVNDVVHNEASALQAWHGGRWDGWIAAKGYGTMAHYSRTELPFYYALAGAFTVCDEYHCSVLGPTFPNRLCLMTGMIDVNGTGGGPVLDNDVPPGGYTWTTYPERLQAAGISWRVYQQNSDYFPLNPLWWFAQYQNARPGNPLYDRINFVPDLYRAFGADVTNGTLPRVSWIIPPWSFSEHPAFSPANGEALVKRLLDILASKPDIYNSTAFILTYDEDGGFFDHVPSPIPPAGTADEFVNGKPLGLGVRVPTIIVSPWTRGGYVCSQIFDHTSILQFLERWTGVPEPNLSQWRRQVCGDLTSAFDFAHPDTNYPALPNVPVVVCTNGTVLAPPAVQTFPAQEPGRVPGRLRPYLPNAFSSADCVSNRLAITLANAGAASAHFIVHANAYRTDGPWHYDVDAGATITDYFSLNPSNGGRYDFTCYGPHRFHRRFAGKLNSDCSRLDVQSSFDPDSGSLTFSMMNSTATPVIFTFTNLLEPGAQWTFSVPPGSVTTQTVAGITNDDGSYHFTAVADVDGAFFRDFLGDLDAAAPAGSTNLPPGLTNGVHTGPILLAQPDRTVLELTPLLVRNAAIDNDIPPRLLTYQLENPPAGAVIDLQGTITWTPDQTQGPASYVIQTVVNDDGIPTLSASNSLIVTVLDSIPTNYVHRGPRMPLQISRTLRGSQPLLVVNTAFDEDLPALNLTYTLTDAPAGAAIDGDGIITWTPAPEQVPSVNTFTTLVADDGTPSLSDSNSFLVFVQSQPSGDQPEIQSLVLGEAGATVTWSSISSRSYRLQSLNALEQTIWFDVTTNILATGPMTSATDSRASPGPRFYRVVLLP